MGFSEQRTTDAIQKRLWKGYGKVARQQGVLTGIYRPTNAMDPFDNMIGETSVVFANNYRFIKPNRFGYSLLFAIFDATNAQQGDYLDNASDVFYIASMDLNVPTLVVKCERVVSIYRISAPKSVAGTTKGVVQYSAATIDAETALMLNFRASILQGTKGEVNPAQLTMDARTPWWIMLMPAVSGIVIQTGDIVRCDLGRKYLVSSAELTDMGWRMTMVQERV